VQAGKLEAAAGQLNLLEQRQTEQWSKAMAAADALRERFGEDAVSLAASLKGRFRERVHESAPAANKAPRK
jgi:DNA polymerase-4